MHVFVDENKARGYLVAAAVIPPDGLAAARRQVNELRMAGQRRIHFKSERDFRRRAILAAFAGLDAEVIVYDATTWPSRKPARDACIRAVVDDCAAMNAHMLVIEQDDSVVQADRRIIRAQAISAGYVEKLRYQHQRAHEEPLLAIPDAVAWNWARGGDWRRRARALVTTVRTVPPP